MRKIFKNLTTRLLLLIGKSKYQILKIHTINILSYFGFSNSQNRMDIAIIEFFNHKKVLEGLKIKSSKKHKAEDFPNVSFGGKSGYEGYSSNISNPIYEGGSE